MMRVLTCILKTFYDLLNLVVPDPNVPMLIPQDVYGAVMEIYGMALKKEYNNYEIKFKEEEILSSY